MEDKEINKGGRPRKFKTNEIFAAKVQEYFADPGGIPTKAGLLLHLDISRETWRVFKEMPGFSDAIRKAEARIENAWLQQLPGPGATGPIFYLKNAFKEEYKDRHETDITTGGEKINFNIVQYGNNDSSQVQSEEIPTQTP